MSAASSVLDRLKKTVNLQQKDMIILYSNPGLGKSSFAAQFDKPQFVTDGKDKGYGDLVRSGIIKQEAPWIETMEWKDLREVTTHLADPTTKMESQSIIFENLGGFQEQLCDSEVRKIAQRDGISYDAAMVKFNGYNRQGFNTAASEFAAWYADVQRIMLKDGCDGKPMRVLLLGHAALVKDKNPTAETAGEEFMKVDLQLHPTLMAILHKDCGNIGWLRQRPLVAKSDKGNRALSDDIRELVFYPSPGATAKNRWNLPAVPIPCGSSAKEAYAAFTNAVVAAKKSNTTTSKETK